MRPPTRVLVAGGGTAGHVLPGLAVAAELVERGMPADEIHFVGAAGRIEERLVPDAGFGITLLPGRGIERRLTPRNLLAAAGLVVAAFKAVALVRRHRPEVVLALGGFASAACALAAVLWRLPNRGLFAVGGTAALAGFGLRWLVLERQLDGHATAWLTDPGERSPAGLLIDVLVNGTHPLLPWLAFFCVGIVLGRMLDRAWWRPVAAGSGLALFSIASMVAVGATGPRREVLLGSDPWSRSLVYTASALGTALVAFAAVTWLAERFEGSAAIDWLRRAGQLSFTIYIAHALVFNLLVDWLDVIEPAGLFTALGFAVAYWLIALPLAAAYQRRFGRGPIEQLYRTLTA